MSSCQNRKFLNFNYKNILSKSMQQTNINTGLTCYIQFQESLFLLEIWIQPRMKSDSSENRNVYRFLIVTGYLTHSMIQFIFLKYCLFRTEEYDANYYPSISSLLPCTDYMLSKPWDVSVTQDHNNIYLIQGNKLNLLTW